MSIQLSITTIFHNEGRSLYHPWTDEDARSRRGYIDSDGNLNIPHYKKVNGSCNVTDYVKWFDILTGNEEVSLIESIKEDKEYKPIKIFSLPVRIRKMKVNILSLNRGMNITTTDKLTYTITFTGRIYL